MSWPSTITGICANPISHGSAKHWSVINDRTFSGQTVAITGAAGGIGQWLCKFFGAEGATIAALDRSDKVLALPAQLARTASRLRRRSVDITDAEGVARPFESFGDVHVLINNAGVSRYPTLAVTDPAGWAADIASNLNGAYACAHAVLPQMVARRSGNIINVGSVNGLSALGDPAYSAAKAGMISLTRSLAQEYGRYGIRANMRASRDGAHADLGRAQGQGSQCPQDT